MKKLVIIDCGSGNLHSVQAGFARAAVGRDVEISVTTQPSALADAHHIVLPGVGAFADCMHGLLALGGMREALEERVHRAGVPFMGICVGMQMLFERSHEHGVHAGLSWLRGEVGAFAPKDTSLKIPHMGWNELHITRPDHPLFAGIYEGDHVYFVHSYHARCADEQTVYAAAQYGETLTAVVGTGNIVGTQFHPEKSHKTGEKLLANFIAWNP